jgi:hypothetical protein
MARLWLKDRLSLQTVATCLDAYPFVTVSAAAGLIAAKTANAYYMEDN